jgi:hypothetical protein
MRILFLASALALSLGGIATSEAQAAPVSGNVAIVDTAAKSGGNGIVEKANYYGGGYYPHHRYWYRPYWRHSYYRPHHWRPRPFGYRYDSRPHWRERYDWR